MLSSGASEKSLPDLGCQHHTQATQRPTQCPTQIPRYVPRASEVRMSRKGDCYDNALMERCFATLKGECTDRQQWASHAQARQAIFEYLEVFYNRQRRHTSLDYLSPVAYEQIRA